MEREMQETCIYQRLREPVANIYSRQVAKCLDDIAELYDLPNMVVERIKKAVEYACKDVDRLNNNKETRNGDQTRQEIVPSISRQ